MAPTPERDNVPPELHQTTWCTERAIDFITGDRDPDTPWFLSVNPYDPHPPYNPPWEYYRRYDPSALPGPLFRPSDLETQGRLTRAGVDFQSESQHPDDFRAREVQAAYYAMIELVDEQFGRLLDALEAAGQAENTVVIFTSDHGESAGDHGLTQKGCRFFDGLTRVPLIWRWPGRFVVRAAQRRAGGADGHRADAAGDRRAARARGDAGSLAAADPAWRGPGRMNIGSTCAASISTPWTFPATPAPPCIATDAGS